jgi:hypothetical protein
MRGKGVAQGVHRDGLGNDLPPTSRTSIKFVKSVNQENDGHEKSPLHISSAM